MRLAELPNDMKDTIYAAILAVESGLEYARECLATHEMNLGRTTLKNKNVAETIEKDIRQMERTLEMLRARGPTTGDELIIAFVQGARWRKSQPKDC